MNKEQLYADGMLALAYRENRLDKHGKPIPIYGVVHTENVMKGLEYVADEGGIVWQDRTPQARKVATKLGYTSVSNCAAMFRECVSDGLLTASVLKGKGWLMATDYGYAELDKWEDNKDDW